MRRGKRYVKLCGSIRNVFGFSFLFANTALDREGELSPPVDTDTYSSTARKKTEERERPSESHHHKLAETRHTKSSLAIMDASVAQKGRPYLRIKVKSAHVGQ